MGTPHVGQPWPVRVVAAGSLAAVVAIGLLIGFGHYTRRVSVPGVLASTAGTVRVVTPVDAVVTRLLAAEGDTVQAGQPLYQLATGSNTSAGSTQEEVKRLLERQRAELVGEQQRQAELTDYRKAALQTRIADLAREVAQIDGQIERTAAFVAKVDQAVREYEELLNRHQATRRDLLDRQQVLAAQSSALETARRDRISREQLLHDSLAELARAEAERDSRLSGLRRQVNDIDRNLAEAEARRAPQILASVTGTVTGIVARAGAVVRAGSPLLTITPSSGRLVAELFAPSEAVGFVKPGDRVLMRYQAYAYQKFGYQPGTVFSVSRAPLGVDEIERGVPVADGRAALFRITVQPDRPTVSLFGEDRTPAIGERLEASVFLETRPIWQWILEPLYTMGHAAVPPR